MKALFRYTVPAMLVLGLLAGCTLSATPPNIPRTGGSTATFSVNGTPINAVTPGVTGTPGGSTTSNVTGTPAATIGAQGQVTATVGTSGTQGQVTATVGTSGTQGQVTATVGASGTGGNGYPVATSTPGAAAPTAYPVGSGASNGTPAATTTGGTGYGALSTATAAPAISSIPLTGQAQAIQFPANATSFVVTTDLAQGGSKTYQIQANAGQRMYITIDGNAVMQIYGPNQSAVTGVVAAINPVQVPLSQAGNYTVALKGSGPVVMSVYIPAANANQNVAVPVPAQLTPIQFQTGATSSSFTVNTTAGTPLGYTLNVQSGQQMTVTTSGNATVALLAPDKVTMVPSAQMPTHQWLFNLSQGGNYTLVLLGSGPVTVNIGIPAAQGSSSGNGGNVSPTAIPVTGGATRVTFGPGNASTKLNTTLVSGTPKAYVLTVNAGQTLYVSTTGSVDVTIYGPKNNVLANGHASFPNRWSAQANQTGDYTFVVSGNGPCQLEFYIPPQ